MLLVLRRLYRTGGPGLLLKLFALPTPDAPWLPLGPEQRKAFQSSKKRAVVDPFSLLIEPVPPSGRKKAQLDPVAAAAKEYERMADLALRVDRWMRFILPFGIYPIFLVSMVQQCALSIVLPAASVHTLEPSLP